MLKSKKWAYKEPGFQPYQHIQSMGDDFIEDLAFQQKDKQYSLERLLCEQKEFHSSHSFKPITEFNKGTSSLQTFVSHVDGIEPLPSGNLDDPCNPCLGLSRHEFELLQSIKPNSESTKHLTFALANKKSKNPPTGSFIPENHPINQLQDIHDSVFTNCDPQRTAKTVLRKRKQLLEYYSEPIGPEPKCSKPNSLWDMKDPNAHLPKKQYPVAPSASAFEDTDSNPSLSINFNSSNATNSTSYTNCTLRYVPEESCIRVNDQIQNPSQCSFEEKDQRSHEKKIEGSRGQPFVAPFDCQLQEVELRLTPRFTEEEIRMIPRFQSWTKGRPSKSIYIKNLSNSVTDMDLASIFQHYQDPKLPHIVYRLMKTGRMRGQAFVDFHSVEMAERALNERNGLALKDKPIVIQFAHKKV